MKATATRLELFAALSQLSQLRPEWRLGQTLANLAMTAGRLDPGGIWELEDEEALAAANILIEDCSEFERGTAEYGKRDIPACAFVEVADELFRALDADEADHLDTARRDEP